MTVRSPPVRRNASPLRFLLLCVGGWTVLRIAAHWDPAVPPPPAIVTPPWPVPSHFAAAGSLLAAPDQATATTQSDPTMRALQQKARPLVLAVQSMTPQNAPAAVLPSGGWGAERHGFRAALMARLLPLLPGGAPRSAVAPGGSGWFPLPVAPSADPGKGQPFWMRRQLAGWSLGGWVYLREGGAAVPDGIAAAGQLGGSQAGLRLAYGVGATGRLRGYSRATMAVQRREQRELAFGLAIAPLAHWPVDFAVEQRVAVGKEGRTAVAAMVSGGVSDVALPHGFRLDAYGQAGIVGARQRDGFADGAVVIDHRLGADEASPLRLGALAAGAVQPGAARLDVGPRLTLRLPDVGEGSRIALDWRQRVAGDARPASGLALTLASDF